jgi:hypothetical protein
MKSLKEKEAIIVAMRCGLSYAIKGIKRMDNRYSVPEIAPSVANR